MDRDTIIEQLIDGDINNIMAAAQDSNFEVIAYQLESGFKGYANYTDEELTAEINERAAVNEMLDQISSEV